MDPFAPINGISLERYADLGAALDGKDKDPRATAEVLQAEGVSKEDWKRQRAAGPRACRTCREKSTRRVSGAFLPAQFAGARVDGFELHFGRLERTSGFEASGAGAALRLDDGRREGCVKGSIFATMVHRVLDRPEARAAVLTHLRACRGLATPPPLPARESPYDELAARVTAALDFERLARIALASGG